MPWWIWIIAGLAMLAGEALTPGAFFIFFFGTAAMFVGALVLLGLGGPAWVQWLLFSLLSVVSLLVLRPRLLDRFSASARGGNTLLPDLIGDEAVLADDLEPGTIGKAEVRGSSWSVRSRHEEVLRRGSRCRVERVDGLTLWVTPLVGGH